jgi:hypothetical protein
VVLTTPRVSVPLTKEGAFYFTDVELNGRRFRFTLETGAGFFAISQRAARALNLAVDSIEVVPGSRSPVVRIDSLRVGGAMLHELTARVSPAWDDAGFDGIISPSLLRGLLATLDLQGSALVLERGTLPAPDGREIVQVVGQDRGGRIDVPITMNGVTIPAVLDTRSSFWIITPDSMQSRLSLAGPPVFVTNAWGPAQGSFELRGARLVSDVAIGAASIERPAVLFRNRPGTVLGVPLMEQFVFTLDQQNGRVRIARRGTGPAVMPQEPWEASGAVAGAGVPTSPGGAAPGPGRRVVQPAGGAPPSGTWTMGLAMGGPTGGPVSIMRVFPGSSAEKEGLRAGDQLVEFNGVAAADMNPAISRAAANGGKPVRIVVMREGRRLEAVVSPYQIP